jgi:large subunit ribosomal protein L22
MEAISTQRYVIGSPKKVREVVFLVKKLSPREAYEALPFSGKRAGEILRKVIGSAMANARQKGMKEEELIFKEIQVTEGPRLRRFRAGARGMAKPYKKRLSHIRVVLTTKVQSPKTEVQSDKSVEAKQEKEEIKKGVKTEGKNPEAFSK